MADYPVLPIFTDALIADTVHLTPQSFGAYVRLLITAWRSPDCSLPDDDKLLARICGGRPGAWKKEIRTAVEPFFEIEGGRWRQKRLTKERARVQKTAQARASGGYAKARKDKETRDAIADLTLTNKTPLSPKKSRETKSLENGEDKNARRKPKQPTKIDVKDWRPSDEDRRYAQDHDQDPDDILESIRIWCENASRAKRLKPSPRAFWQGWVRREQKSGTRAGAGKAAAGRGGGRRSDEILDAGRRFAARGDLD